VYIGVLSRRHFVCAPMNCFFAISKNLSAFEPCFSHGIQLRVLESLEESVCLN
jgi:hypothetical protein